MILQTIITEGLKDSKEDVNDQLRHDILSRKRRGYKEISK